MRRLVARDAIDGLDHARRRQQRVVAQRQRRGAGVGVLAGHGHVVPLLPQGAADHANRQAGGDVLWVPGKNR